MYILDTNSLIYFFKGMGRVADHLLNTPPKDIGIPTVVLFELEYGILKSTDPRKRITQLEEMLAVVNIVPFDRSSAHQAAIIRSDLERRGIPIGPFDTLIAGTVLAHQATLVTHNVNEFQRIKQLQLVDWY
jgi:tRNA(fMet)-specific endonuclease VapC